MRASVQSPLWLQVLVVHVASTEPGNVFHDPRTVQSVHEGWRNFASKVK